MVAAWCGGLGPALLALVLSYAAADYWFVEPRGTLTLFSAPVAFAWRSFVFFVVGATVAWATALLAAARRREEETERQLQTLVRCVPVGIFRTDQHGKCLYVNERWSRMTGLSMDQAAGDGWLDALHPEDRARTEAAWDDAVRRSREFELEYRFQRSDGCVTWVSGRTAKIFDASGRLAGYLGSVNDVTERKRAEDALAWSEARSRRLVESNVIGVLSATREGHITDANQAVLDMLGYGRDELAVGALRWTDLTPPEFAPLDRWAIEEADERGACTPYEKEYVAKDGRRIPVLVGFALLEGSRREYIAFTLDLRRLKEAEAALIEADRRKDEFLAMLAHELRNPLVPIRNAVEILKTFGADEEPQRKARDMIDRQVSHLAGLIDDLLDVSRMTSGKVTLRKETLVLSDVLAHAVESTRGLIAQHGHTLTVSPAPQAIRVEADAGRLAQVLMNLITNAARFTEPGGQITLSTELVEGCVAIRVRDTGIGIQPELMPRIFDLFVQGDRDADRRQGGLGIGLTMVRALVELHEGRVEARSAGIGQGAEFVVTLPALPAGLDADEDRAPAPRARVAPRALRVLVAEDHGDAAESTRMVLELEGHDVRVARTGLEALEVAEGFPADVAIIDIGLPGLDGHRVAERLRTMPAYRSAILIAMSGYGRLEDKEAARGAGFDHHLTKPVDVQTLRDVLVGIAMQAPASDFERPSSTVH